MILCPDPQALYLKFAWPKIPPGNPGEIFKNKFLHNDTGPEIATDTVANATNISPLATKNSGLVAILATTFLCVDDE